MEDLHVRPHIYEATPEFQTKIKSFIEKFPYRLDTNYAKIDRIEHEGIERFKNKTLNSVINGKTIKEWARIIGAENSAPLITQLKTHFDISN